MVEDEVTGDSVEKQSPKQQGQSILSFRKAPTCH